MNNNFFRKNNEYYFMKEENQFFKIVDFKISENEDEKTDLEKKE